MALSCEQCDIMLSVKNRSYRSSILMASTLKLTKWKSIGEIADSSITPCDSI